MDSEEPALPPNPELLNRQPKWFKPMFYGVIISSVIFAFLILAAPLFIRKRGPHYQTETTSNARQIGIALLEFETDYGAFPSDATAADVTKLYPSHGFNLSGKSSNALFLQFFAAGLTQSEAMFYAKSQNVMKPDGIITPSEALKSREVGFAYISGLTSKDDPRTPIALSPIIPGTTKFDRKIHKGNAVILHIDNSVSSYDIHKDGHVYDKGINLLSPKHPVWKGKAPDIRYPE